jgi:hypothetical protein
MTLTVISPAQGLVGADRGLNIVVLSEGFLASREAVFLAQVTRFDRVLRRTSPFHRFPSLITVSALFVPSNASIAHITDATRCAWRVPNAAGQHPPDNMASPFDTAFGALYCRQRDNTPAHQFVERALAGDNAKVRAAINAEPRLASLRVSPLVLVDNTKAFGGLAPDHIGWFSMVGDWVQVAIHELGHSAFGLADEYDNEGPAIHGAFEPINPNITTRGTHTQLRDFFAVAPTKFSLQRWSELIDPATPAPTSLPNPTCVAIEPKGTQSAKPGVPAGAVGLFEGADYSPCGVFRPRLDCRMRHNPTDFCPVCEWSITASLARTTHFLRVDDRATVPGAWTVLGVYHEAPAAYNFGSDLCRLVLYASPTGDYSIFNGAHLSNPIPPAKSAAGSRIDALWTTLSTCVIGGLPHLLAHSLPLGRIGIYEAVTVDAAGTQRLDLRFDSGNYAAPWTHVTTFESRAVTHLIGYQSGTGQIEISRIDTNATAPTTVSSTVLDPTNRWLPGYTIITTFTVDSVPHVLKHNAIDGVVHVQSLDPPGTGPNTFISKPGHWNPGATAVVVCENFANERTFVHRMSLGNYEALDWIFPGGAGVELQARRQSLDLTLSAVELRGKNHAGFGKFLMHKVAALDVIGGRVRFMSVG